MKLFVLLQVSWLTFLGQMAAAVPNPAFVALSEHFRMPIVNVSYELTVYIFVAGAAPLLITPISNVYGRRPIYLIGNAIGASMNVIAGNTDSWTSILVTRVFAGIGTGSTIAIGAATVCDMFFLHERGFYMGIYTYFLTNGPHFAPLMGGFLGQYVTWQSCFSIPVSLRTTTEPVNADRCCRATFNWELWYSPRSSFQKPCITETWTTPAVASTRKGLSKICSCSDARRATKQP